MEKPTGRRLISGTHTTLWWNGDICYEASGIEIKLKANREQVQFPGDMTEDSKLMSVSGTYTVKIKKIYSRSAEFAEQMIKGIDPRITLIAKIADPDSYGHERVQINNAWFDEIPVFTSETGKIIEEEYSGGFTGLKFLDKISEQQLNNNN